MMSPRWEVGGNPSNVSRKREESPDRELSFSLQPDGPLSPAQQPVDVPREPEVSESFSVLGGNGVPIPPCVLCREVTDTVFVHTCDRPLPEKHIVSSRTVNGGETAARPLPNSISAPETGIVAKKVWAWERQSRVCEEIGNLRGLVTRLTAPDPPVECAVLKGKLSMFPGGKITLLRRPHSTANPWASRGPLARRAIKRSVRTVWSP